MALSHLPAGGAPLRVTLLSLLGLSLVSLLPAASAVPAESKERPVQGISHNFDIRVNGRVGLEALLEEYAGPVGARGQGITGAERRAAVAVEMARVRAEAPGAEFTPSPMTGGMEVVRSPRGFLTAPDRGRVPSEVALDFIRSHAPLYGLDDRQANGLRVLGESRGGPSGLRVVRLEQVVHGRPVFQSETRAIVDRDGRLVRTVGRLAPVINEARVPVAGFITPEEAVKAALATVGIEVEPSQFEARGPARSEDDLILHVGHPRLDREIRSRLVYFPLGDGVLAPAWSIVAFTPEAGDWYMLVDARHGKLLYRKNIEQDVTTQEARFGVYAQAGGAPADSPAPASPNALPNGASTQFASIARTTIGMLAAQNTTASPNGWIPDGGTTTTGNNVDAFLDRDNNGTGDVGTLDNNGYPTGNTDAFGRSRDFVGTAPRDFEYTPAPSGANPDLGDAPSNVDYQRGAVTSLFFLANYYHDKVYALGFDEGAANFQTSNFGLGGIGADAIQGRTQAGAGLSQFNNASFATPPDGSPGIVRMYLWSPPSPDRDGSLDAEIVLHELTHGLTNRMIGNANGLNWQQGGGMGEGWSDFFAMSLLNRAAGDNPDGQYGSGAYVTYRLGGMTTNYLHGIRRFPYSTANTINPLTWADADDTTDNMSGGYSPSPLGFQNNGAWEVHNLGEIWALTLWEVRSRIIAANAGNVAVGSDIALQIVFDALALTPLDPTFIDARDALIDADCAANACANEASIWGGFADRGLGYYAHTSSAYGTHLGVKQSFEVAHLDVAGHVIDDTVGGNASGRVDPGETVRMLVNLTNPWRGAGQAATGVTATLTSSTPGVTILDGASSYPNIAAQTSSTGDTFEVRLDLASPCGGSVQFNVTTTSSLGVHVAPLVLRAGTPTGPGAPITFTANPGAPVPDNNQLGLLTGMTVTADREILDLDFRVNDCTQTWAGDMSFMLRGPSGFGTDLIFLPGSCAPSCSLGTNDGDNYVDTRIDDEATMDLLLAGGYFAPFTGSWIPFFNSPQWLSTDPVGQLSHFDGTSTKGLWNVLAVDHGPADFATLNSWSIIVTPQEYACCFNASDADLDLVRVCDGDCDDTDPDIYPGAPQICGDAANNNCTAPGWPSLAGTNEGDDDGDGLSECQADCDDTRMSVYPGAPQICDGLNNNCSDISWPVVPAGEVDGDGDNAPLCGDCDDARASVYPGAPQLCDGLNNNCSEPSWPAVGAAEIDADGDSVVPCAGDCNDALSSVYPGATQVCGDGLNNDCTHVSWPGLAGTNEVDNDGDLLSTCAGDCNDADAGSTLPAGETGDLALTHNKAAGITSLTWGLPPGGGMAGLRSDVIKSTSASDFVTSLAIACLESNDASDMIALDPLEPLFSITFYLQRWENGCPGTGIAGRDSAGVIKPAVDCP